MRFNNELNTTFVPGEKTADGKKTWKVECNGSSPSELPTLSYEEIKKLDDEASRNQEGRRQFIWDGIFGRRIGGSSGIPTKLLSNY